MSCLQVRFNKTLQSKDSLSSATVPGYLYCCTSSTSINHHRRDDGRTLSENHFLLFTSGHIDVQQKDSSYQAANSTPAQGHFQARHCCEEIQQQNHRLSYKGNNREVRGRNSVMIQRRNNEHRLSHTSVL